MCNNIWCAFKLCFFRSTSFEDLNWIWDFIGALHFNAIKKLTATYYRCEEKKCVQESGVDRKQLKEIFNTCYLCFEYKFGKTLLPCVINKTDEMKLLQENYL